MVFSIAMSLLGLIRSVLSELSLFWFSYTKKTLTRGRERRVLDEPAERSIARTLHYPPLVRVNLSARHSARASKVSMAGAGSMISEARRDG